MAAVDLSATQSLSLHTTAADQDLIYHPNISSRAIIRMYSLTLAWQSERKHADCLSVSSSDIFLNFTVSIVLIWFCVACIEHPNRGNNEEKTDNKGRWQLMQINQNWHKVAQTTSSHLPQYAHLGSSAPDITVSRSQAHLSVCLPACVCLWVYVCVCLCACVRPLSLTQQERESPKAGRVMTEGNYFLAGDASSLYMYVCLCVCVLECEHLEDKLMCTSFAVFITIKTLISLLFSVLLILWLRLIENRSDSGRTAD